MKAAIFDTRRLMLGEGPLWHPERKQLFWFDILGKKLLSHLGDQVFEWQFDEYVSAAGWLDDKQLLIASETALFRFDIETGSRTNMIPLEAEMTQNRSNDGRADPWGGFWIGTMGKQAEKSAGAIYRYYKGELRRIVSGLTIPNAICFSPDRGLAYFTDTRTAKVMRQRLSPKDGWPLGSPELFLDLSGEGLNPDGAVVDAAGNFWNAQWGAARVASYAPDGRFLHAFDFPASQTSCPAFGGAHLNTLYVTSAAVGLRGDQDGLIYAHPVDVNGQPEHRIVL